MTKDRRRRVLIVDDEEYVLRAFTRVLGLAHDVTALSSSAAALRRVDAGETWDVVLCDLQMPDLDGVEFSERLRAACPGLAGRIVFITGGAFTPRIQSFLKERNVHPILEKPVPPDRLRAVVERAAEDHEPEAEDGAHAGLVALATQPAW
jgi:CheY-like chemotaxis protein